MTRIGTIDDARLALIPDRYRGPHEYCFHLHDLMVSLLLQMERQDSSSVSFILNSREDEELFKQSAHVLDFLAGSGRTDIERRVAINRVSMALYADMLHFIYEALIALEKRKFTVALSLLRKPFKEGLLMAAWACADEIDFFVRLKENPRDSFDAGTQTPERVIEVLQNALTLSGVDFVKPEFLYELLFDRKNEFGLAQLFDKATHLVTKNKHLATENYNINFIFKNAQDNDLYAAHYSDIATTLLVMHHIQVALCSRMDFASKGYLRWLRLVAAGTYEAIFKARSPMRAQVNRLFKELMTCPNCGKHLRVDKRAAPRFFVLEVLSCGDCRIEHHFPLGWLLSRVEETGPG